MGSPLGPTQANILLTALEDEIVRPLINAGTIKFYAQYVDDTLILTKPENIHQFSTASIQSVQLHNYHFTHIFNSHAKNS